MKKQKTIQDEMTEIKKILDHMNKSLEQKLKEYYEGNKNKKRIRRN